MFVRSQPFSLGVYNSTDYNDNLPEFLTASNPMLLNQQSYSYSFVTIFIKMRYQIVVSLNNRLRTIDR